MRGREQNGGDGCTGGSRHSSWPNGSKEHGTGLAQTRTGGSCPLAKADQTQKRVLRYFQWNRSSHSGSSDGSAPALTLCPFPAFGRPIRTELGAPNSRTSGALLLQPCIRPPREPRGSPTVVPLIGDKRYYGGTPVRRWRYQRQATQRACARGGRVREALVDKLACSKKASGGGAMGIGRYQGGTRPVGGHPEAGRTGRMDSGFL